MEGVKLCVIGGGSTYTPELIEGIINRRQSLPVREVALVDLDTERLEVVAGLARRMIATVGLETTVTTTDERRRGIAGADFVLNQIRIGGQAARIRDERIGRAHDVIGQETTGEGGFAKALRTIPVALAIAADVRELSPDAWMLNFTNPAGMVTEALLSFGGVRVMGLCNGPFGTQVQAARVLGLAPERVRLDYIGLNHLSWVRGVYVDGENRIGEVIEGLISGERPDRTFDPELLRALGMIPSGYLSYFYNQRAVLGRQRDGGATRGEQVAALERQLLQMYGDPDLCCKPPLLAKRGGAHYSTLAIALVAAIATDAGEVHIVNCLNNGAIADLPPDVAVEVPAVIDGAGAHSLTAGHLPWAVRGLVQQVKAYEELTIEAAINGSEQTALLALLNNPLVPCWDTARELWGEIKAQHKEWLPQFT